MKKGLLTVLLLPSLLISSIGFCQPTSSAVCYAQSKPTKGETKQEPAPPANQIIRTPLAFGLEDGTPIKIRITRTISSADATVDEKVDFEVLEEMKIGDVVVIPRGGIAWGTVTEAQPKRRMGRAGKLNVNIDSVRLVTGERVALRAVKEVKGGSHTGAMTGAIVATSIVFFPAAPLFLLMHGKDITIPKGTELTAYVNGDASLDPAKFAPKLATTEPAPDSVTPPPTAEPSTIVIKSTPDGADITVDGKFVGSTPSTLKLTIGEHTISIEKAGFTIWTRAMTVSTAGSVSIEATLEKVQ